MILLQQWMKALRISNIYKLEVGRYIKSVYKALYFTPWINRSSATLIMNCETQANINMIINVYSFSAVGLLLPMVSFTALMVQCSFSSLTVQAMLE